MRELELEVLQGGAEPRERFELVLTPRPCSPGTFSRVLRAQVPFRGVAPCFRLKQTRLVTRRGGLASGATADMGEKPNRECACAMRAG